MSNDETTAAARSQAAAALAAYDEQQRDQAARQGRPIGRMSNRFHGPIKHAREQPNGRRSSVTVSEPAAVVWLEGRRLLIDTGDGGRALRGDDPMLVEHDPYCPNRIVFANRASFARTMTRLDGQPRARFAFVQSLGLSTMYPILTDLLTHLWWLPQGRDETKLNQWAQAFNVQADRPTTIRRLFGEFAYDETPTFSMVSALARAEAWGMAAGQWRSLSASCAAFKNAEQYTDLVEAITALDRQLAERNVIARSTNIIDIGSARARDDDGRLTLRRASVEEGIFSHKLRSRLLLNPLDPNSGAHCRSSLEKVDVAADESIHLLLGENRRLREGRYLVAKEPFTGGMNRSTARWSDRTQPGRVRRDVPLDVALAGAPSGE
ncbi:hypothetical protein [Aeromicrobium sp. CTD01-1L150]|uniref:hypothetical protein n=1 Tax=Aeromicrobium sp. CTD01-1L150 TaxID=3341830 RepID=UPI0035C0A59E